MGVGYSGLQKINEIHAFFLIKNPTKEISS